MPESAPGDGSGSGSRPPARQSAHTRAPGPPQLLAQKPPDESEGRRAMRNGVSFTDNRLAVERRRRSVAR
jgi:hypothetical protein